MLALPGPTLGGPGWLRWSKPVAVSLALHLALAAWMLSSRGGLGRMHLPEPAVLETRLLSISSNNSVSGAETARTENAQGARSLTRAAPVEAETTNPFTVPDTGPAARATQAQSLPSAQQEQSSSRALQASVSREPSRESGYLGASAVDRTAAPLEDVTPDYPAEAGLREGTVVLRLLISATGHVDAAQVLRATPKNLFEASASRAFLQARFSPAQRAGIDVASQLTIEVHFTPTNRDGGISGRLP